MLLERVPRNVVINLNQFSFFYSVVIYIIVFTSDVVFIFCVQVGSSVYLLLTLYRLYIIYAFLLVLLTLGPNLIPTAALTRLGIKWSIAATLFALLKLI